MCRSLLKNLPGSRLWILCFDDTTYEILKRFNIENIKLIHHTDFEDIELLNAKNNRSLIEYYWTCTPALPLYLLKKFPDLSHVTYLDADLYFFNSPSSAFKELGEGSIFLTEHNYSSNQKRNIVRNGRYNVQFIIFKNDSTAIEALEWWKYKCLEWCHIRRKNGKLGDQKYLDDWKERYPNVRVSNHKGIGLAPWNVGRYSITVSNGKLYVDEDLLVFFHFHYFSILKQGSYRLAYVKLRDEVRSLIYHTYIDELEKTISIVKDISPTYVYENPNIKLYGFRDPLLSFISYIRNNNVNK